MVRTQSIISVSDEIGVGLQNAGSASNVGPDTRDGMQSVRKNRIRGRRVMTKTLKNISGSSQEDTGGLEHRIGLPREEMCGAKSCSPHRRGNNSSNSPSSKR
jgi:hypothetical protein